MKRTLVRRRAASVLVGCMAIYLQHQVLAQAQPRFGLAA
jgi:iron complex outermembrane receptor protein